VDAALAADPGFAPLTDGGSDGAFVMASIGAGWRIGMDSLAASVVGSAALRLLLRGEGLDDWLPLADEAERALAQVEALLAGDAVELTVAVAFSGVTTRGDVELPWGTLRSASDFAKTVRPFRDLAPAALLEVPVAVRYLLGEPDEHPEWGPDAGALLPVERGAMLLPVAVLLGVERESYPVAEVLWRAPLLPGASGPSYSGPLAAPSYTDRFAQPLDMSDAEWVAIAAWADELDRHYHGSIDVAIRRLLSATRERIDQEAALIDAVIAMESLFGHGGETEVTFRVTTAIALLLEPDPARRAGFRSQLAKVYKTRSQVVHGGTPDPARVHEHKEEAVALGVRCMRLLLRERPHLIPHQDRGMRLILGADDP
jgi:hypothetical protein